MNTDELNAYGLNTFNKRLRVDAGEIQIECQVGAGHFGTVYKVQWGQRTASPAVIV
jgi:hypothetical protein